MEGVAEPLVESQEKVAEAVLLFCQVTKGEGGGMQDVQGLGLLPSVQRKASRQDSAGDRWATVTIYISNEVSREDFHV